MIRYTKLGAKPPIWLTGAVQREVGLEADLAAISHRRLRRSRVVSSKLRPPVILPARSTITVKLVTVRPRANDPRRRPHSHLAPPEFYPSTSAIGVRLVTDRGKANDPRYRTHSRFGGPVVLALPPAEPINIQLQAVEYRESRQRRHLPYSILFPPIFYPAAGIVAVFLPPEPTPQKYRRRGPFGSIVRPPVVVAGPVFPAAAVYYSIAVARRRQQTKLMPLQGWQGTPSEAVAPPGAWNAAVWASNPFGWWRLDDTGTTAVDQLGRNPGTYQAGTTQNEEGLIVGEPDAGISVNTSGTNGVALNGTNAILSGQTTHTIEIWISRRNPAAFGTLWQEFGSGHDRLDYELSADDVAVIYVEDNGTQDANNVIALNIDDARKHIVITRNGNTFLAYVNGVASVPVPLTLGPQTDPSFAIQFAIGMNAWADEVVVYQRVLSAAEVAAHFRAGAIGPTPAIQYVSRFIGPRPPRLIITIPNAAVFEKLVVIPAARNGGNRRKPHYFLGGPTVLANPPPADTTVNVTLARTRPRRVHSTFVQPNLYPQSGIVAVFLPPEPVPGKYGRRGPFHSKLSPPIFYPATSTITVEIVRTRPRHVRSFLSPPEFYPATSTIEVALTRARPRKTRSFLAAPVFYPATSTVEVTLAHIRPRRTHSFLGALIFYPQTSLIGVELVHTRPRKIHSVLAPPTVLSTFGPPVVELAVRIPLDDRRRRAPRSFYVEAISYPQATTITLEAVRTRPRRTHSFLAPPQFYPATSAIVAKYVQTRPRRTHSSLFAPQFYPQATPLEVTLAGATRLADRRRGTRYFIEPPIIPPTVAFSGPTVKRAPLHRRFTHSELFSLPPSTPCGGPPGIVQTAQGSQAGGTTVAVTLGATPADGNLLVAFVSWRNGAPTLPPGWTRILDQISGGSGVDNMTACSRLVQPGDGTTYTWTFTHGSEISGAVIFEVTNQGGIAAFGGAGSGTNVVTPSATAPFASCLPLLGATGDAGTNVTLSPSSNWTQNQFVAVANHPLGAFSRSSLANAGEVVNPTATIVGDGFYSSAIVVLVAPCASAFEPPIEPDVTHVETRPRRTHWFIAPPAELAPTDTTIDISITRTRPRRTHSFLTSVFYPQATPIFAALVRTRPRRTHSFVAAPIFYPATSAVGVKYVGNRPRRTHSFLTFVPPAGPLSTAITNWHVLARPRRTHSFLAPPEFYPQTSTIEIKYVTTRPRRTHYLLVPPIFQPQTGKIAVTLVAVPRRRQQTRLMPLQGWQGTPSEASAPPGAWNAAVMGSGPYSWWKLDDTGATAVDQLGRNPGTYSGAVKLSEEGQIVGEPDTGVAFNVGGTGGVNMAAAGPPILAGQTQWTYEAWVSPRQANAFQALWTEQGSGNDLIGIEVTTTGLVFSSLAIKYVEDNGTQDAFNSLGGSLDESRKHIVVTRSGNTLTGFVNGVQTGSFTGTLGPQTDPTFSINFGGGANAWWDEVVIYLRALPLAEIAAHFRAGVIGPTPAIQYVSRFIGPRPPRLITTIPAASVETKIVAIPVRADGNRRKTDYFFITPNLLAQPPPVVSTLAVYLANGTRQGDRRRGSRYLLEPPAVITQAVFTGPSVTIAKQRRRPVRSTLGPLIFYPQTTPLAVFSTRIRPRKIHSFVAPPTVLQTFGPAVVELAVRIPLDDRRRRAPRSFLSRPIFYPATSSIEVKTVRTRPRRTHSFLTAVSYPASSVISTHAVRTRPRHIRSVLAPPAVLQIFGPPEEIEVSTHLVSSRPRRTRWLLSAITYPAVSAIRATTVRTRPRHVRSFLAPPNFQAATSTIKTATVRTRPRKTVYALRPPTVLQTFAGPSAFTTRIRPRRVHVKYLAPIIEPQITTITEAEVAVKTVLERPRLAPHSFLNPPVILPATSEIQTSLVRTRPRRTTNLLGAPETLQVFSGPAVSLTSARPRPTSYGFITPVTYPQATPLEVEIDVTTVRVERLRRGPFSRLSPPEFYPSTSVIQTQLVRARPRLTRAFLTAISYPATSELGIALARTRPRLTTTFLRAPAALATFEGSTVKTVRTRPRATTSFLAPPTVVLRLTASETTLTVELVRTRPRPTISLFVAPALTYPATSDISVTLAGRTRLENPRRAPHSRLHAPVFYPATSEISAALVRARPRRTAYRLFSPATLQTFGPPVENEIAVQTPLNDRARRRTHSRLAPPVFVAATSQISTALVRTRPRQTRSFLTAVFYPATSAITVAAIQTRPRRTHHFLTAVSYQATSSITTHLVHTRPRRTSSRLTHITYAVAGGEIKATLARIRPRHTQSFLTAPTVRAAAPVVTRLTIRIPLERTRRLTHSHLSTPVFSAAKGSLKTTLAPSRRPRVHSKLSAPTVLQTFAGGRAHQTQIRPRHVRSVLAPPAVVTPVTPPTLGQQTLLVVFAPPRPRFLSPAERIHPIPPLTKPIVFTSGYTVPKGKGSALTLGSSIAEGDDVAADAASSQTSGAAAADASTVPTGKGSAATLPTTQIEGATVAAAVAESNANSGAAADAETVPAAVSEGEALADSGASVYDIAASASESRDERAGT